MNLERMADSGSMYFSIYLGAIATILLCSRHCAAGHVYEVLPSNADHDGVYGQAAADIQQCLDKLSKPGDQCRLPGGVYDLGGQPPLLIAGKNGSADNHIILAARPGESVVFRGATELKFASPWSKDVGTEIWSAKVATAVHGGDGMTQLFDGETMYVPARWPDAFWHDKTMFQGPEHWGQFNSSMHNLTSGLGYIIDGGHCPEPPKPTDQKVHCDRMVDLGSSRVNASGSIVVLNEWSCDSGAQFVTTHSPGDTTIFYKATHYPHCDKERTHGRYYLVGKREFLSSPTEWYYDRTTATLYVIPEEGKDIHSLHLYAKDSTWAINITDSSHITVANISFFATALLAADGGLVVHPPQEPKPYPWSKHYSLISDIRLESLRFDFPAASRRMLGETVPPDTVTVYAPPSAMENRNIILFNCTFMGSDGPSILIYGSHVTITQSLFSYTDWSGVGASPNTPGRDGHMCTLTISGKNNTITRNTFAWNGNSAGLCSGPFSTSYLNDFYGQAEIQTDGTHIEFNSDPSNKGHIVNNWSRDTGKLGYRFDSPSNASAKVGDGGLISHNVAINTSGIRVGSNGHIIEYNTVVDGTYVDSNDPTVSYMYQEPGDKLNPHWPWAKPLLVFLNKTAGESATTLWRKNAADSFLQEDSLAEDNVIGGFDAALDLRDAWNLDFRPCSNSVIAKHGAGAYDVDVGNHYWIPGRQLWQASMPIPQHGTMVAKLDTDLIFLGALNSNEHSVYFGKSATDLEKVAELSGNDNVAAIGKFHLQPFTAYYWRVDAVVDNALVTGRTWNFTTGARRSCE
eukprot:scpid23164/ scgid10782/ 